MVTWPFGNVLCAPALGQQPQVCYWRFGRVRRRLSKVDYFSQCWLRKAQDVSIFQWQVMWVSSCPGVATCYCHQMSQLRGKTFHLRGTMSKGLWMKWCHSPERNAGHPSAAGQDKPRLLQLSGYYYCDGRIQQAPFLSCSALPLSTPRHHHLHRTRVCQPQQSTRDQHFLCPSD